MCGLQTVEDVREYICQLVCTHLEYSSRDTVQQGGIFRLFAVFEGDILRKQHFSWDLGCCFGSLVLQHAYKLWKKSVHDFLSEICISESTPPTVTKQASQFRRPLLRRKGAQLNITSHFPTPLQSEHSYDFVDQRTSSSGRGNSAAAQLRE
jgi:hypothetical protein